MIRQLNNLVILREIDIIKESKYTSKELAKKFPHSIIIIRRIAYIYRDVLCEDMQQRVTNLDDYMPTGEFVEQLSIQRSLIKQRIKFMKNTGSELFHYITVCGVQFIKVDEEFKHLFQNFHPFLATLKDYNIKHCKMLGDLKIGFY